MVFEMGGFCGRFKVLLDIGVSGEQGGDFLDEAEADKRRVGVVGKWWGTAARCVGDRDCEADAARRDVEARRASVRCDTSAPPKNSCP